MQLIGLILRLDVMGFVKDVIGFGFLGDWCEKVIIVLELKRNKKKHSN